MKRFLILIAFVLLASCSPSEPYAVLDLPPSEGNSRNSEGDFILLNNGDILFAYSKFVGDKGDDHDKCVIVSRKSSDKGDTWTAEDKLVAVNELEPDGNVMSVSFLRLNDGRIALFYLQKVTTTEVPVATNVIMKTSSDEGETWSEETDCTLGMPAGYRVVNNARVIRLSSGRIIMPVALHYFKGKGEYDMDWAAELYCLYSDDEGLNWQRSEGFYIDDINGERVLTQEPGIIELKDDSVLMYIRANTGYQWYASSFDGGQTWQNQRPASFVGPLSPATFRRLNDGRLINIFNDHEGREDLGSARTPLTIAVSTDEGETWPLRKDLETGHDPEVRARYHYCYTAAIELNDRLLLAYCAEDHLRHLRIMSVPKTWIP